MIIRRIEVKEAKEIKEKENVKPSLVAFFLSLPWCCITPVALSFLGFLGAAGTIRLLLKEALFPLLVFPFYF